MIFSSHRSSPLSTTLRAFSPKEMASILKNQKVWQDKIAAVEASERTDKEEDEQVRGGGGRRGHNEDYSTYSTYCIPFIPLFTLNLPGFYTTPFWLCCSAAWVNRICKHFKRKFTILSSISKRPKK